MEDACPLKLRIVLATPSPVTHRTAEENLGLGFLTAALRCAGHTVYLVDAWLEGLDASGLVRRILSFEPDLVGFAAYRSNIEPAVVAMTAIRLKLPDIPVIAGGFGPTFHPDDFLAAGFDVVAIGEADNTIVDLADHYASGEPPLSEITGIAYRDKRGQKESILRTRPRVLIADLDRLQLPARDTVGLSLSRHSPSHVQSSRGCQASCVFCSIVAFERISKGPQWRQYSIPRFVDQIEDLACRGVQHIKVVDDSFIEPPRDTAWCEELANEIERRNIRVYLRGQIRADRVDGRTIAALARAGFWSFACGIENFAETALRRMAKRASIEVNHAALREFQKAGIVVQAGHILFDRDTTLQELETNYAGFARYPWTISKGVFTEMYAATGTAYTRRLMKADSIIPSDATPGTGGLGNMSYVIRNPRAQVVHTGLKAWQKSHSRIYDMTIDPLSAPKAIDPTDRITFQRLSLDLRQQDLETMRGLLHLAREIPEKAECLSAQEHQRALDYVRHRIASTAALYDDLSAKAVDAYETAGLVYDADDNPFIC